MGASREELNQKFIAAASAKPCDVAAVQALLEEGAEAHTLLCGKFVWEQTFPEKNPELIEVILRYQDPSKKNQSGKTSLEALFSLRVVIFKTKDEPLFRDAYMFRDVLKLTEVNAERIIDNLLITPGKLDLIPIETLSKLFGPLLQISQGTRRVALVGMLLAKGASPNVKFNIARDNYNMLEYTPLHYLAEKPGSSKLIKRLLESGADANITCVSQKGATAIEYAMHSGQGENVLMFIQYAKSPISPNILSKAFYHVASIKDNNSRDKVIAAFLERKVNLASPLQGLAYFSESEGAAAIWHIGRLIERGYWSSALLFLPLIDSGVLQAKALKESLGSIMGHALLDNTDQSLTLANQLLSLGAEVNQPIRSDVRGGRLYPINIVARKKDWVLFENLFKAGADLTFKQGGPYQSKTPLEILVEEEAWDSIPRAVNLSRTEIKPEALSEVIYAAITSKTPAAKQVIEPLLLAGADPNGNNRGGTLLDVAVANKDKELIAILLRYKAKPHYYDKRPANLQELGGDALVAVYEEVDKAREKAETEREERRAAVQQENKRIAEERRAAELQKRQKALEEEKRLSEMALQEVRVREARKPQPALPKNSFEVELASLPLAPQAGISAPLLKPPAKAQEKTGPSQLLQDFKKINEDYLGDHFLVDKEDYSEKELKLAINQEIKAHPNGPVAIAVRLAEKYRGCCDSTNDDFLVALRLEQFKHERLWVWCKFWNWGKKTIVHKEQNSQQTFFRASSFEKFVKELSAKEKHTIAEEMRAAAADEKDKSRSAEMTRKAATGRK